MIGSFPITFAKHQASHHKLRIWKMRKIPCWLQDCGLLFLSSRMPQVLAPAPSSGPRSRNRPIAYCYEESVLWKYIKYIILSLLFSLYQRREWKWYMELHCTHNWIERWKIRKTKRSAAVSSMWTLAQMI